MRDEPCAMSHAQEPGAMRHVGMCSWESKARGEGSYPPPSFPGADDFFMTAIKKSRAECSAQPVRTQDAEAGCHAAVVRLLGRETSQINHEQENRVLENDHLKVFLRFGALPPGNDREPWVEEVEKRTGPPIHPSRKPGRHAPAAAG